MPRKAKTRKPNKKRAARKAWAPSLNPARARRVASRVAGFVLGLLLVAGSVYAINRLDTHVEAQLIAHPPAVPRIAVVDVPEVLRGVADSELHEALLPLLDFDWTDDRLCREMAALAGTVGWVRDVVAVKRTYDACFEVRCTYRLPFALVQQAGQFILVDREGVRLPGTYLYDDRLMLVQGVEGDIPDFGEAWEGQDLQAALKLIAIIEREPFANQISAVLVGNYGGRCDKRKAHVELATDRAGGRIRWGSAPGEEIEENSVGQKLAILRANYQRSGRIDENHPVIDISTYANRYTVPR
jgi:hypothetical protein